MIIPTSSYRTDNVTIMSLSIRRHYLCGCSAGARRVLLLPVAVCRCACWCVQRVLLLPVAVCRCACWCVQRVLLLPVAVCVDVPGGCPAGAVTACCCV